MVAQAYMNATITCDENESFTRAQCHNDLSRKCFSILLIMLGFTDLTFNGSMHADILQKESIYCDDVRCLNAYFSVTFYLIRCWHCQCSRYLYKKKGQYLPQTW